VIFSEEKGAHHYGNNILPTLKHQEILKIIWLINEKSVTYFFQFNFLHEKIKFVVKTFTTIIWSFLLGQYLGFIDSLFA